MNATQLTIYVATRNRGAFLEETLRSLAAQTLQGFAILVGDNASDDDTPQRLRPWAARGVEVHRSGTLLPPGENLHRGFALARTPWVMVYHDDDLMHPAYVETIVKLLTRYPEAAFLTSGMQATPDPHPGRWEPRRSQMALCGDRAAFVDLLFRSFAMMFSSTVYRTDSARRRAFHPEIFGKVADYPFVIEQCEPGRPVLALTEAWSQYRVHPGQDIQNRASGPFLPEVVALHRFYRGILGTKPWRRHGRTWLLWNDSRMKALMEQAGQSYWRAWPRLWRGGASTPASMALGIAKRLVTRLRARLRARA